MAVDKLQVIQTYTVDEIAVILDIGRNASYTLVNDTLFSCIRVGNLIRIPCSSFNAWFYDDKIVSYDKLDIKKQVYKISEISKILNIKKTSSYALIKDTVFVSLKIGNSIRIPIESFNTWLNDR